MRAGVTKHFVIHFFLPFLRFPKRVTIRAILISVGILGCSKLGMGKETGKDSNSCQRACVILIINREFYIFFCLLELKYVALICYLLFLSVKGQYFVCEYFQGWERHFCSSEVYFFFLFRAFVWVMDILFCICRK